MQWIADTAAINAAQQSLVDSSLAATRAQAWIQAQFPPLSQWNPTASVQSLPNNMIQVTISGSRQALLKKMLPSNGWQVSVSATAQSEGQTPLCALSTGTSSGGYTKWLSSSGAMVDLEESSSITAPSCLVQSNQNLYVGGGASINSGRTQAVGSATGNTTPAPQGGAAAIPDPFSGLDVTVPTTCTDNNYQLNSGPGTMAAGVHCGNILLNGSASVTLQPGTHYFYNATMKLTGSATFTGTGVTLVFDNSSTSSFTGGAHLDLTGATSGPFAGFVLVAARDNSSTFNISTQFAHVLEGVVYIPNAVLKITGNAAVADQSAWTVIVAQAITLDENADLTLNANYSSSSVPVPNGVGPNTGSQGVSRLVR